MKEIYDIGKKWRKLEKNRGTTVPTLLPTEYSEKPDGVRWICG